MLVYLCLYVCNCVIICVRLIVYLCVFVYVYHYVYVCISVCMCIYVHKHVCLCAGLYVCMLICVFIYDLSCEFIDCECFMHLFANARVGVCLCLYLKDYQHITPYNINTIPTTSLSSILTHHNQPKPPYKISFSLPPPQFQQQSTPGWI